jgi:hypothetical protein
VLRVGSIAPVALPRGTGYIARTTKATLLVLLVLDDANVIGRGCFGASFLIKSRNLRTTTAGPAYVLCGRRCWLVEEDVLPG